MNWTELSHRMERSVIKKDSTATDNQYFMATHVPFQDLEVIESGDMTSEPAHLSEEEIYRKYILNRANRHQMIIVRGQAGTGKSHLICWLYNRLVNDVENYNPEKEKVIFLRRLGNTSRGAVQQMLEAGMVQDLSLIHISSWNGCKCNAEVVPKRRRKPVPGCYAAVGHAGGACTGKSQRKWCADSI